MRPNSVWASSVVGRFLLLWGHPERKSITNDVEAIGRWLAEDELLDHAILYEDSDGVWDGLVYQPDGTFGSYAALSARTPRDAMRRAREKGLVNGP